MTYIATQPVDTHVGKCIRHRRWMLGQTQQQLAEACGIRFQQVQKYETGFNRVSASRLYQIAVAQGVPVAWYFEALTQQAHGLTEDAELMEAARALATVPASARPMIIKLATQVTADV